MKTIPEPVLDLAETVFIDFTNRVVEDKILRERAGVLSEKAKGEIRKKKRIDARRPLLLTMSGKGGWDPDPVKRKKFEKATNISLLDHLLSVSRGAMLFILDSWYRGKEQPDLEICKRNIALALCLGIVHDSDKILKLDRSSEVSESQVQDICERYGINSFLLTQGCALEPCEIRHLIAEVEASQSHRYIPEKYPPPWANRVAQVVRLADNLESVFLTGGIDALLKRLTQWGKQGRISVQNWSVIDIFDPHHPFLLDLLQRSISAHCHFRWGLPPLLETHMDGRLVVLLPADHRDAIVKAATQALVEEIVPPFDLTASNRGVPSFQGGRPDFSQLRKFLEEDLRDKIQNLFVVNRGEAEANLANIDSLGLGLSVLPSKGNTTRLDLPFDNTPNQTLIDLSIAAAALNVKGPSNLSPEIRETQLLEIVPEICPEWIRSIRDGQTRRTMLAIWATSLMHDDLQLRDRFLGLKGLAKDWWREIRMVIDDASTSFRDSVEQFLRQLVDGLPIEGDSAPNRCLFTNIPTPSQFKISEKTQVKNAGINVSAFSGRDNRPEGIDAPAHGVTHLSPVSIAEHRKRAAVAVAMGKNVAGIPVSIYVPTTAGLFGGYLTHDHKHFNELGVLDFSRLMTAKGKIFEGVELHQSRCRVARLERFPDRLASTKTKVGQIAFLRMAVFACMRLGRPLHIFRGLPMARKDFFYVDFMPEILLALLRKKSFRLEELPMVYDNLETIEQISAIDGYGIEAARLFCYPGSHLDGMALAAWKLARNDKNPVLRTKLEFRFFKLIEEDRMTEKQKALIQLGKAAARIQRGVTAIASTNEQLLVYRICFETLETCLKDHLADGENLIHAITGELEHNLVRKNKAKAKSGAEDKALLYRCQEVAQVFVNAYWINHLDRKLPNQSVKRIHQSIYRMAFLSATHPKENANKEGNNERN